MEKWSQYFERSLGEARAERERVEAIFEAELQEAVDASERDTYEELHFENWPSESILSLADKITGRQPITPIYDVAPEMWEAAIERVRS